MWVRVPLPLAGDGGNGKRKALEMLRFERSTPLLKKWWPMKARFIYRRSGTAAGQDWKATGGIPARKATKGKTVSLVHPSLTGDGKYGCFNWYKKNTRTVFFRIRPVVNKTGFLINNCKFLK